MRKLLCALLCVSSLLALAGCDEKEQTDAPAAQSDSQIPEDLAAYISEAVSKTTAQTSFHMTGTHSYDALSVSEDKDGNREERPFSSLTTYDMVVNGYGTADLQASGTRDKDGAVEMFSVIDSSYRYMKTYQDGTTYGGTEELDESYSQCDTLAYCAYMMSLPGHETTRKVIAQDATASQTDGSTTVTASVSPEDLVTLLPRQGEEGDFSEAAVSITVSADGFCSEVSLSYEFEGYPHEYRFQFRGFGQEQQIDELTVTVVSGDAWQRAFSPSSFENVTITRYYDDRTKENPFVMMIDGPVSASTLRNSYSSSDGISMKTEGMTYFFPQDGEYFELEVGTVTDQDGVQTPHYKLTPTDTYAGETAGSFSSVLNENYSFSGQYDDYTYDAASAVYTGTSEDEFWIYHFELSFENELLSSVRCTLESKEDGQISTVNSYYFTDYGTTVIEIPDA